MIDVVELGGRDLNLLLCLIFQNYLMFYVVYGWRFGVGVFSILLGFIPFWLVFFLLG